MWYLPLGLTLFDPFFLGLAHIRSQNPRQIAHISSLNYLSLPSLTWGYGEWHK